VPRTVLADCDDRWRRCFVIGSLLNVINQGDAFMILGGHQLVEMALIYCVPFCVATFGAYSAYRAA
jgi:hypothetical protein